MIKFFRRIRQNLLNKNKVSKYLLYAFGEIILVVIGILIALNLNQRSEQKKAEAKIDAIFEDVLIELENDINRSTEMIYHYRAKDSLASLVLNTNLTYEDYANENSSELWRVPISWDNFNTSISAYNLLLANMDAIPSKYKDALIVLDAVYNRCRPYVEEYNKVIRELTKRIRYDFEENYAWYSESDLKKNKDAIEYRLNNYKYKNKVKSYKQEAFDHRVFIEWYRFYSITAFKEISEILNKPTDSLQFIINYKALDDYVGIYINNASPDTKMNILLEENYLLLKKEGEEDEQLLALSSEQIFFPFNPKNVLYRFNKNDDSGIVTFTEYKGHEATTYTKANSDN
ncbi:hypothetical protein OE09_1046 [Flavobacteriaceae bacterium MAR_2010_72]|nr:hypothetical protein OE09_1046 [Flavobacteriaceae bacterium MAR_2010_72]